MNPYQPPKADIQDTLPKTPIVGWALRLLILLWFGTSLMTVPYLLESVVWLELELWLFALVIVMMLGLSILPYFFLLFLPVKKLKQNAWKWWLITGWGLCGLYIWSDVMDDTLLQPPSLTNWLLFISGYVEVVVIWVGAFRLRTPVALAQLRN